MRPPRPRSTRDFKKKIQLSTILAHFVITITFMALIVVRFSTRLNFQSCAIYCACVTALAFLEMALLCVNASNYISIILYSLILIILTYLEDGKIHFKFI